MCIWILFIDVYALCCLVSTGDLVEVPAPGRVLTGQQAGECLKLDLVHTSSQWSCARRAVLPCCTSSVMQGPCSA